MTSVKRFKSSVIHIFNKYYLLYNLCEKGQRFGDPLVWFYITSPKSEALQSENSPQIKNRLGNQNLFLYI